MVIENSAVHERTSNRPSLEKSWDAFYAIVCDFLRENAQVEAWLRELQARADVLPAPEPTFWNTWFADHHAVPLLQAEPPLESLGVLLAVRLPPPQVFRFAFPWPWSEFRARRTLFGTPGHRPDAWLPPSQIIRHIHTQMNFSFGDLGPEFQDGVPLYNSMMRASFEGGSTVHCCDVFTKLATDQPETYTLQGPDNKVLFRSVEGQAQKTFGLRTVVYIPCRYESRGGTARGFCLALYSPIPGLFGVHQESFEVLPEPAWMKSLRGSAVLERFYDALVECDRTARFTTYVIMNSLYENNLRRASLAADKIKRELTSGGIAEHSLSAVDPIFEEFVNNSHIAAFQFLSKAPDTTELSITDVESVLSGLRRAYASRPGFHLEFEHSPLNGHGNSQESPMAKRLKVILQAYLDNASKYAVRINGRTSATIRFQQIGERGIIEVSNTVKYPVTLEEALSLERYWWIREALAPPGPGSKGPRSGGIQLFLLVCLCRGSGLEPELIMDVPVSSAKETQWRSRVSFIVR